jgi:hypothetical protein
VCPHACRLRVDAPRVDRAAVYHDPPTGNGRRPGVL